MLNYGITGGRKRDNNIHFAEKFGSLLQLSFYPLKVTPEVTDSDLNSELSTTHSESSHFTTVLYPIALIQLSDDYSLTPCHTL